MKEFLKVLKLKKKDFVGIFIGRLGQEKNVLFLIDVMKKIVLDFQKNFKDGLPYTPYSVSFYY